MVMTMMKCFPDAEEELIQADFSLSPEVLAAVDLVAVLAVEVLEEADLAVSAAAEVSAAVELLEVGNFLRAKEKVKRAK